MFKQEQLCTLGEAVKLKCDFIAFMSSTTLEVFYNLEIFFSSYFFYKLLSYFII